MRLNKFLSDAGICSRRQADKMLEEGRILVDGRPAVMGEQVTEDQEIIVDGRKIALNHKKIVLAFYKPKGIVCTAEKREKDNIIDYINYPERIYPMGRLDKDSEGLILLTNDGELMNEILRARNYHEKEYEVKVNRPVTADFIRQMSEGVEILDTVTRPCVVRQTGACSFRIVLTQGLNRQIRRMCEALGYRVRDLKRYRIMNIYLGDLELGKYRKLTPKEYDELLLLTGRSGDASSETEKEARKEHSTYKNNVNRNSRYKSRTDKGNTNKISTDKSVTNKRSSDKSSTIKISTNKSSTNKRSSDKSSTNKRSTNKNNIDRNSSYQKDRKKGGRSDGAKSQDRRTGKHIK